MYPHQPVYPIDFYAPIAHPTSNVQVSLNDEATWNAFSGFTTEMIVSKAGRKIFPKIALDIKGLSPNEFYTVEVHFERVDPFRYRFDGFEWVPTVEEGEAEGRSSTRMLMYGNANERKGRDIMGDIVDFSHYSLTNNPDEKKTSMIFVQSQHKYVPVVHVFHMTRGRGEIGNHSFTYNKTPFSITHLHSAEFIAVTCYQHEAIKMLKVAHNPFARGSRSVHNQGRKRSAATEEGEAKRRRTSALSLPSPSIPFLPSHAPAPSPMLAANLHNYPQPQNSYYDYIYADPYMPMQALRGMMNPPPGPLPFPFTPREIIREYPPHEM